MARTLLAFLLITSIGISAEVGSVRGIVTNHGAPVKRATIKLLRDGYSGISPGSVTTGGVVLSRQFVFGAAITMPMNAPGLYSVTCDKRGRYGHFGLPVGIYTMGVEISGRIVEQISGVTISAGKNSTIQDFELSPPAQL